MFFKTQLFFKQEMILYPAVIDGEFLPKSTEELLAAKEFNTVPYLLGMNNHEYGWVVPVVRCAPSFSLTKPSARLPAPAE